MQPPLLLPGVPPAWGRLRLRLPPLPTLHPPSSLHLHLFCRAEDEEGSAFRRDPHLYEEVDLRYCRVSMCRCVWVSGGLREAPPRGGEGWVSTDDLFLSLNTSSTFLPQGLCTYCWFYFVHLSSYLLAGSVSPSVPAQMFLPHRSPP